MDYLTSSERKNHSRSKIKSSSSSIRLEGHLEEVKSKPPKNKRRKSKAVKKSASQHYFEWIESIQAKVDCSPPKFAVETFMRPNKFQDDLNRLRRINHDNLRLLQRLNAIQRSRGQVDCYNQFVGTRLHKNNARLALARIDKIEAENFKLFERIIKTRPEVPTRKYLEKVWIKDVQAIEQRVKRPIVMPSLVRYISSRNQDDPSRPKIFLDLKCDDGRELGRLIIVLYHDLVPNLCENFIELCMKRKKRSRKTNFPHLTGTTFYRIFPGLFLEGGDMVHENGCGGIAAQGTNFLPENFKIRHDSIGTLSMIPAADKTVNSIFSIDFKPLSILDGKRPAFGRIIKGFDVLKSVESLGSKQGKPKKRVLISNCGLVKKPASSNYTDKQ